MQGIEFTLAYYGRDTDRHIIDFYDVSRALIGFQRTLAMTTHLILNDELITQATALKGARIALHPATDGSWKATALVFFSAVWAGGTVSKDTPVGNMIASAYDYAINEALGFHVDYNKTLGQQYDEYIKAHPDTKKLKQGRFDGLAEKCTAAVIDMHRPVVFSRSANCARIFKGNAQSERQIGHDFNSQTFDYVNFNIESKEVENFIGSVSGYSKNSFTGRILLPSVGRLVSFYLTERARTRREIRLVTTSLSRNSSGDEEDYLMSEIILMGRAVRTRTGILKKIIVEDVFER